MVSCKQCSTLNSLDSTFCKRCGAALAIEDIAEASEKLTAMIADGNKLFADGRTEEAMMVAETAVANNPSSPAAISLKGMVHERKGQIAEALECFERVVELNPDSMLDKIKVNDLRNMLVMTKVEAPRPDRRAPLIAAIAASVLVVAGGAIIAKAASKPPTDNGKLVALNNQVQDPVLRTFGDIQQPQTNTQTNTNTGQTNPQTNTQAPQTNVQQPDNNTGDPGRSDLRLPRYNNTGLPRPNEGIGGVIPPVQVEVPQGLTGTINANTGQVQGPKNTTPPKGNENTVDAPPTDEPPVKQDPPKNDPGIIMIERSKGQDNVGGGNAGSNNANGREALVQAARSQMMSGNYNGAANTYERALRSGAEASTTYQRLGQCYERMGRNSDAIAAYQRAAASLESSINSGRGDKASLQNRLDSCRQAIKVLGG